mgnify:CR=1 FL=1
MDYGLICDYMTGQQPPVLPAIFFVKDGVFISANSYAPYNQNYQPTFTISYDGATLSFYVNNTLITPITQTNLTLGAVSAVFGNIVSVPISIDNIKFTGSAPDGNFPQQPQNIQQVLQTGNDSGQLSINNVDNITLNTISNAIQNNDIIIKLDGVDCLNLNKTASTINDLVINGDLTLTNNLTFPNPNITSNTLTLETNEYNNTMYNGHVQFNNNLDSSNWVIKNIGDDVGYFSQSDLVFTYTDNQNNVKRPFNLSADGSVPMGDLSSTNAPKVYVSGLVGSTVQNGLVYDTYFNQPPTSQPQNLSDVLNTGNDANQFDINNVNSITLNTISNNINNPISVVLDGSEICNINNNALVVNTDLTLTQNSNLPNPNLTSNIITLNTVEYNNVMYNGHIDFNNTVDNSDWNIKMIGKNIGYFKQSDLVFTYTDSSGNAQRLFNLSAELILLIPEDNEIIKIKKDYYKNLMIEKYEYSLPHKTQLGNYQSICNYRLSKNELLPFYFETPKLKTTSGIVKIDNKYYIDLEISQTGENGGFYDYILKNDEYNINTCYNNSKDWFNQFIPLNIIENYYKSPVILRPNGSLPIIRLRIPSYKNNILTEIYNIRKEKINDISCVEEGDYITAIIEFSGLMFFNKLFMPIYEIQKIKIFKDMDTDYIYNDETLELYPNMIAEIQGKD